jgi:hypothetical protein
MGGGPRAHTDVRGAESRVQVGRSLYQIYTQV